MVYFDRNGSVDESEMLNERAHGQAFGHFPARAVDDDVHPAGEYHFGREAIRDSALAVGA